MSVAVAGGTKIEWADFTFNPWWGCEKVSPGCAHCYADTLARRRAPGQRLWGEGHEYRFFGDGHWAEPLKWARLAPAKLGRRPRVFCASMADVFEEGDIRVEGARRRLFGLILETAELDWLVLTKRPEFAKEWLSEVESFALVNEWPIPNVWLGVSIENSRYTWRADVLRQVPAAVRFISAEPLLGSLFDSKTRAQARAQREDSLAVAQLLAENGDLTPDEASSLVHRAERNGPNRSKRPLELAGIDWVIIGGESGHGARPMQLTWAREILEAVDEQKIVHGHDVALFVKQLGAKPVDSTYLVDGDRHERAADRPLKLASAKGDDPSEWPADLRIREHPRSAT